MRLHRLILLAAVPLALAALPGSPASAQDFHRSNALITNGLSNNGLSNNALTPTGTALTDLDGVAVEAVTLPDEAR